MRSQSPPRSQQTAPQRRYTVAGHADRGAAGSRPGLHIVATPIGNLGDITLRALATLAGADLIACEDTRVTRKLLDRYAIATPLTPYHDHNAATARPKLLRRLADGAADRAGLRCRHAARLRSRLQARARRAGSRPSRSPPLPGASALLAALTVAGLPTDQFFFAGFLPPKQAARRSPHRRARRDPGDARAVRNRAAHRRDACRSRRRARRPRGRGVPRAHQAARGGPARRPRSAARDERASGELRGEIVLVIAPPPAAAQPSAGDADVLLRAGARARFAEGRGRRSRGSDRTAAPRDLSARAGAREGSRREAGSWRAALEPLRPAEPRRGRSASRHSGSAFRRRAAPRMLLIAKGYRIAGAALENAVRRDRHRRAAPRTRWSSSRSRRARRIDDAAEAVTERSKRRIVAAAELWLAAIRDDAQRDIRFDVMLVDARQDAAAHRQRLRCEPLNALARHGDGRQNCVER